MELRTISATSLQTFEECPKRWLEENVNRTPRSGNTNAADNGTACHAALEEYVGAVYVDKKAQPNLDMLLMFYKNAFMDAFKTVELDRPEYAEGVDMLTRWFDRADFEGIEIVSLEKKDFIEIRTSAGPRKYNYIWDRCDKFTENGKKIIRVVDYKTIRANLSPEDLSAKIQARMYAMAAAIQFKDEKPDEIWVQFDLLRYSPVEVTFNRDQNVATWNYVKATAERILAMNPAKAPETLGPGCQWCVRKTTCNTLRKNIAGGGIYSLQSDEELLKARYELESVQKAAKYGLEEIDDLIMSRSKARDEIEWEAGNFEVKFTSRRTRSVDTQDVVNIIGADAVASLGKVNIGEVEKLLKGNELTAEQKSLLRGCIRESFSDPKPKITRKAGV